LLPPGEEKPACCCVCCRPGSDWECLRRNPLPDVGPRCGALRVRDAEHNWRIMYRIDADAVLILDVYSKKTRTIPDEVIERCRQRMKHYDAVVRAARKSSGK